MQVSLQCPQCNKTFFRDACFIRYAEKAGRLLKCSRTCASQSRRTSIEVACEVCREISSCWPSQIQKAKHHYCSQKCAVQGYQVFAAERFWRQVDREHCLGISCGCTKGLDCCWRWLGSTKRRGYGTFGYMRKNIVAHRMAFAFMNNIDVFEIPKEIQIAHICDNPPCVRHLFPATCYENIHDCIDKGRRRYQRGETHANAIFTEEDIKLIRQLHGVETQQSIAERFHTTHSTIHSIHTRRTWKHIL